MFFLGIDKGKTKHHAYLLGPSDEVLMDMAFDHTPQDVRKLIVKVGRHEPDLSEVCVAIETKNGILITTLMEEGFSVFSINPKTADSARKAMNASGAKCDRVDAMVLATHLKQHIKKLHKLLPQSDLMVQIKSLVEFRQTLVADKVAIENRLQAILENYFPAADTAFDDFSLPWVIGFLEKFPTPEKASSTKKVERWFMSKHKKIGQQTREKAIKALQAEALTASRSVVEVESRKMLLTLLSLKTVLKQIHDVEKEIKLLFETHKDSDIFNSLPGAGQTLAPWLMSQFGDNRDVYTSREGPMQTSGVVPVTFQSGKSKTIKMRRACIKEFRQAMRLFSEQTIRHNRGCPWARRYYDKRRENGDRHETALRKLAKRWISIIWRLWRDRVRYCDEVHVKNVLKRSKPKRSLENILVHV